MNEVVSTRRPDADFPRHQILFFPLLGGLPHKPARAAQEHHRHDAIQDPVRDQVEQRHPDGGGDDHVHDERRRGTQPHRKWLARVDRTSEANMVLSGSSPMKMIGNTAAATARFTMSLPAGLRRRLLDSRRGW